MTDQRPATGDARPGAFEIEVRPDGGRATVVPHGELDIATVDRLRDRMDRLVARGCSRVVLDLRRTTFMDSTGLRLVIAQSAREDATVSVIDGTQSVRRLFDVTGVRSILRFDDG